MPILAKLASKWDFFGIPNTESKSRGFGIGIFLFQARSKNPEIQGSGLRFENPEKSRVKKMNFFSWDGISRQKAISAILGINK